MKYFNGRERGFTLIELLAAIPIIGILGLTMTGVLVQLQRSHHITQGMTAIRQVQAAGDSVSQDAKQAQKVHFNYSLADPYDLSDPGWYLNLSWGGGYVEGGDYVTVSENVTYTLRGMQGVDGLSEMVRHESTGNTSRVVARYLDVTRMSCHWEDTDGNGEPNEKDGTFSLTIVAVLGDRTEERTYHMSPPVLN